MLQREGNIKMSYLMAQPNHFGIYSQNLIREMEVHNQETRVKSREQDSLMSSLEKPGSVSIKK